MEDAVRHENAIGAKSGLCEMQAGQMPTRNKCTAECLAIDRTAAQGADCAFNRPSNLQRRKRPASRSTEPCGRLAAESANAPVHDDGSLRARAQLCAARDRAERSLVCTEPARRGKPEIAAVKGAAQPPRCARANFAVGDAKSSRDCCERAALRRGATPPRARALPCSARSAAGKRFPGREQVKCPGVLAVVFLQLKLAAHWLRGRSALALVGQKSRRCAAFLRVRSKTRAAMPTAAGARRRCVRMAFRQS